SQPLATARRSHVSGTTRGTTRTKERGRVSHSVSAICLRRIGSAHPSSHCSNNCADPPHRLRDCARAFAALSLHRRSIRNLILQKRVRRGYIFVARSSWTRWLVPPDLRASYSGTFQADRGLF